MARHIGLRCVLRAGQVPVRSPLDTRDSSGGFYSDCETFASGMVFAVARRSVSRNSNLPGAGPNKANETGCKVIGNRIRIFFKPNDVQDWSSLVWYLFRISYSSGIGVGKCSRWMILQLKCLIPDV